MPDNELTYDNIRDIHRVVENYANDHFPMHSYNDDWFRGIVRGSIQGLYERERMWNRVREMTGLSGWRARDESVSYFKQLAEDAIDG